MRAFYETKGGDTCDTLSQQGFFGALIYTKLIYIKPWLKF